MQETFVGRLRGACAVLPGSHVLVAVSGGADSTALLCFFCEIRETYPISVSCAHVEHGIRGAASEEDMRFVKALCEQKNVPFYGGRVDAPGYARAHGCGLEEAARALRYDFLEGTAEAVGADAIALAHHRGDQAETVLLHAARGSDIRGLCAMRWRRGKLIRPLLDAEPEALRAYLRRIGQPWREDETNACEDYARNRIRRSALHPALAGRALVGLIERAGAPTQSAQTVSQLLDGLPGRGAMNLSGGARAEIGARYVAILRTEQAVTETPLNLSGATETPFGTFIVRRAEPGETGDGVHSQTVDADRLAGAVIAPWQRGEAMTPLGAKSSVRMKKLLEDVEHALRRSVPVLKNGENTLLWMPGVRPAEICRGGGGNRVLIAFVNRFEGDFRSAAANQYFNSGGTKA